MLAVSLLIPNFMKPRKQLPDKKTNLKNRGLVSQANQPSKTFPCQGGRRWEARGWEAGGLEIS